MSRSKHKPISVPVVAAVLLLCAAAAGAQSSAPSPDGFLIDRPVPDLMSAELEVFGRGASALWQVGDVGGSGIGGVDESDIDGGPRDLGRKFTAGLLSLVLPGAGQYYNGDHRKAAIFAGAEAAVWTGFVVFDKQGDGYEEDYREYATSFAGVSGSHSDDYWRELGRYMDSDAYNEALLRDARADGLTDPVLVGEEASWQWRNEQYQTNYRKIRADANRANDRRDFMTAFAIINRVVSVVDAVRSAGDDLLSTEIAGFSVDFEVSSSFDNPGTGWIASRAF